MSNYYEGVGFEASSYSTNTHKGGQCRGDCCGTGDSLRGFGEVVSVVRGGGGCTGTGRL